MRVLLISTYELGRQPFGLASPAAWLREAGFDVRCVDAAKEPLADEVLRAADLVAVHLPMHTATRLAVPIIARVSTLKGGAHLCCYGLYAPLNAAFLRSLGVDTILGGEFEADLVELARRVAGEPEPTTSPQKSQGILTAATEPSGCPGVLPRLPFRVPDRTGLPPLVRYASLHRNGTRIVTGYTEASRGCKHLCRHCPVVPIYGGQFRVVPVAVVLEDIGRQVAAGARHITFGDPDFFNGIRHALAIVESLARQWPAVTYDATIKIEHLLRHAEHLPTLGRTGCLFVTSAVESIDDRVLALLDKGHTRADFERVVERCCDASLALAPTFVAFHPWISLDGYCELLRTIARLDLVEHVAPIQLAIRLLVPGGSRLLELREVRELVGPFDRMKLAYPWRHPDPRVDALHEEITAVVGAQMHASRRVVFDHVFDLAHRRAGLVAPSLAPSDAAGRAEVPYLNEPWYC